VPRQIDAKQQRAATKRDADLIRLGGVDRAHDDAAHADQVMSTGRHEAQIEIAPDAQLDTPQARAAAAQVYDPHGTSGARAAPHNRPYIDADAGRTTHAARAKRNQKSAVGTVGGQAAGLHVARTR
jgi:hypothetical protein